MPTFEKNCLKVPRVFEEVGTSNTSAMIFHLSLRQIRVVIFMQFLLRTQVMFTELHVYHSYKKVSYFSKLLIIFKFSEDFPKIFPNIFENY